MDKENAVPGGVRAQTRRGLAPRDTNKEPTQRLLFEKDTSKKLAAVPECPFLSKFEKPQKLFMFAGLTDFAHGERVELVQALVTEPTSATAWWQLLSHLKTHKAAGVTQTVDKKKVDQELDRVFRKALILVNPTSNYSAFVAIHVAHAKQHGTADATRAQFVWLSSQRIGEASAFFYTEWAAFEAASGDDAAAVRALELGLSRVEAEEDRVTLQTAQAKLQAGEKISPAVPETASADTAPKAVSPDETENHPPSINLNIELEVKKPLAAVPETKPVQAGATPPVALLPTTTLSAAAAPAPVPAAAVAAAGPGTRSAGLLGRRAGLLSNGGSGLRRLGAGGPMRVAGPQRVAENDREDDDEDDDNVPPPPALSSVHLAGDFGESNANAGGAAAEEAPADFVPLLAAQGVGGELEEIAEGSFTESEASRRDSTSSLGGGRHSSGSGTGTFHGRSSTSSGRSSTSSGRTIEVDLQGMDDTEVVPPNGASCEDDDDDNTEPLAPSVSSRRKSSRNSSRNEAEDDDTAVIFKGKVSKKALDRRMSTMMEDDTAVVFRGPNAPSSSSQRDNNKRPGQQDLSACHEPSAGNSASLTCEAGHPGVQQPRHNTGAAASGGGGMSARVQRSSRSSDSGSDSDDDATHPPQKPRQQQQWQRDRSRGGHLSPEESHSGKSSTSSSSSSHEESSSLSQGRFSALFEGDNEVSVNGAAYCKIGVLGKGGSSKVFRVLNEKGDLFALKRVRLTSNDPKTLASFENEIALMESLRGNPNIVQLVDSQVLDKCIYMVMEAGETDLNGVLQRHQQCGSLSANFVRLAWQQMLTAVQVIHDARIVHGDLKPANFLFVQGHLKLIDFGIAKQINEGTANIYRESQVGTLNYMSPEAIQDSGGSEGSGGSGGKMRMKLGRASDIWSLGCILYQMVYGRTPFSHITSLMAKLMAIVDPNHEVQFPALQDKSVLFAIKGCLERDPKKRPPIAGVGGLLKQPFLEPASTPPSSSSSSHEGAHGGALPLSAVKAIVRRTVSALTAVQASEAGSTGGAPTKRSVEELTALVVENICAQASSRAADSPPSSNAAPETRRPSPQATGADAPAQPVPRRANREELPQRRPLAKPDLGAEIVQKISSLRSGEDARKAAAKYQVVPQGGGGNSGGLLGSLSESEMLARNISKRRQDMAPDETVNNTGSWDVTESWQN